MNREQAAKLLPIIQAFAEGKTVQFQMPSGNWAPAEHPTFDPSLVYRIKPEPREWTLAVSAIDGSLSIAFTQTQSFSQHWLPVRVREIIE